MRIGLDASWAAVTGTGTASYTRGLVEALVEHREHSFVLYFRPGDEATNPLYPLAGNNVERRIVAGWGQPGRSLLALGRAASHDRLDLFHSPGYFLPLWSGPKFVTFHDVNMFLQWDKWWRPGMRSSWLSLCAQTLLAARLSRRVLADSKHASAEITRVLRLPAARVSVLYPGVDEAYFSASQNAATKMRAKYGLSDYLLVVGVLSPQKNLAGAVRALAMLGCPDLQLAVVGREDGPYYQQEIEPLIERLGLTRQVRRLGVVPAVALPSLYAGARAFLYPSFAEGFGLPPLEAMAAGTPVIASDRSSLPEVLNGAALLVDPTSSEAIASAITRVLHDPETNATLRHRGAERARDFRWRESARRALEIYATAA